MTLVVSERIRHEFLPNGLHEAQGSVNYIVYEERVHNKSSSRTDLFRKRTTSFSVGLARTVRGSVCVFSLLALHLATNHSGSQPLLFPPRVVSVHHTHVPQRNSVL